MTCIYLQSYINFSTKREKKLYFLRLWISEFAKAILAKRILKFSQNKLIRKSR